MTLRQFVARVEQLKLDVKEDGDWESIHIEEDDLRKEALRAVVDCNPDAIDMARAILAVADMNFTRWHA